MQEYYDLLGVSEKTDIKALKEVFKNKKAGYQADLTNRDLKVQRKAAEEICKLTEAYKAISAVAPKEPVAYLNGDEQSNGINAMQQQENSKVRTSVNTKKTAEKQVEKTISNNAASKLEVTNRNSQIVDTSSDGNQKTILVMGGIITALVVVIIVGAHYFSFGGLFKKNKEQPPHFSQTQTKENGNVSNKKETKKANEESVSANVVRRIGTVTGNDVIMRSVCSTVGSQVAVLNKGDSGEILERQECRDRNAAMLMETHSFNMSNGSVITAERGYALVIDRSQPEVEGRVRCTFLVDGHLCSVWLPKADIKEMYGDIWYKIRLNNGLVGWVYGKFLRE